MGTLALTHPSTFETFLKQKLGNQFLNQNNNIAKFFIENGGDPTSAVTPDFIGQICVDTTNSNAYIAMTAISSGWTKIN